MNVSPQFQSVIPHCFIKKYLELIILLHMISTCPAHAPVMTLLLWAISLEGHEQQTETFQIVLKVQLSKLIIE